LKSVELGCKGETAASYFWPFKGGARRERWVAAAMLLELWLTWWGLYVLAGALGQH